MIQIAPVDGASTRSRIRFSVAEKKRPGTSVGPWHRSLLGWKVGGWVRSL
jgi:hypothetical protein